MTYWEAADILEHGSVHYGKVLEAEAVVLKVLKELIKKLYGNSSDVIFVDEFVGSMID